MVLIERQSGKRVDPETDDVYHTTFDWPDDPDVQERLVHDDGALIPGSMSVKMVRIFIFQLLLWFLSFILLGVFKIKFIAFIQTLYFLTKMIINFITV